MRCIPSICCIFSLLSEYLKFYLLVVLVAKVEMGGSAYQVDTVPLLDIPAPVRLRRPQQEAAKENEIRYNLVLWKLSRHFSYFLVIKVPIN